MAVADTDEFRVKVAFHEEGGDKLEKDADIAKTLADVVKVLEARLRELGATLQMATKQAAVYNAQSLTTTASYVEATTRTDEYAAATTRVAVAQKTLVGVDVAPQLAAANKATSGMAKSGQAAVSVFTALGKAFNYFTKPENLARLSAILKILSMIARARGAHDVADGFEQASSKLVMASHMFAAIEGSTAQASDGLVDVTEKLFGFHKAILFVKDAGTILALTLGGIVAVKGAQYFLGLTGILKNTGGAFSDVKAVMDAASGSTLTLGQTSKTMTSFGDAVERLGTNMENLSHDTNKATKFAQRFTGIMRIGATDLDELGGKTGVFADRLRKASDAFDSPMFAMTRTTKLGGMMKRALNELADASETLNVRVGQASGGMRGIADTMEAAVVKSGKATEALNSMGRIVARLGVSFSGLGKDIGNIGGIFRAFFGAQVKALGALGTMVGTVSALTAGFAGLGFVLLQSDSTIGKLAGTTLLALAASLGGILVILKAAGSLIGQFLIDVGSALFVFFDRGLEGAKKAEKSVGDFGKSIARVGAVMGASNGNLTKWNATVDQIAKTTHFSSTEARTMSVEAARMGQTFNFAQGQQMELAVAIAAFSKNGEEANQVSNALRNALEGNADKAEEFGIKLDDATLSETDYAKIIGKTLPFMTEQEKVQTRLNAIFAAAAIAIEVAGRKHRTYEQILADVEKKQKDVDARFASGSIPLYKTFAEIQEGLLDVVRQMPQGFFDTVSSVTTFTGVALMAIGSVLKWGLAIAGLIAITVGLNAVLGTSAFLQGVLTTAFMFTNSAVGAQTVAVTGLTTIWANFVLLAKGAITATLKALGVMLAAAAVKVWAFTAALLANPAFWAGAAIVVAIIAMGKALLELSEKSALVARWWKSLKDIFSSNDAPMQKSISTWETLGKVLQNVIRWVVDLATVILTGLLQAVQIAGMGFVKLQEILGDDEDAEAYQARIAQMNNELYELQKIQRSAAQGVFNFGGVALAAAGQADQLTDATGRVMTAAERAAAAVRKAADEILASYDQQIDRLRVFGDEYDRAIAAQMEAQKKLANVQSITNEDKEKAQKLAEAERELQLKGLEIEKLNLDKMREIEDENAKNHIEMLRRSGQTIAALRAESKARLDAFDKNVDQLSKLGQLTVEDVRKLASARQAMVALFKNDQSKEFLEQQKKLQGDAIAAFEKLTGSAKDMREEINKATLSQTDVLRVSTQARFAEIAAVEDELRRKKALSPERQKELNELRDLTAAREESGRMALGEADRKRLEEDAVRRVESLRDKTRKLIDERAKLGHTELELAGIIFATSMAEIDTTEKALQASKSMTPLRQHELDQAREALRIQRELSESDADLALGDLRLPDLSGIKDFFSTWSSMSDQELTSSISNVDWKSTLSGMWGGVKDGFKGAWDAVAARARLLTFGDIGKALVTGASAAAELFASAMSGAGIEQLAGVFENVGNWPDKFLKSFMKLDEVLTKLVTQLPQMIRQLVARMPELVAKIVDAIPIVVKAIAAALPLMAKALVQAAPEIISALMDSMPMLIEGITQALVILIDGIPNIIGRIMERLPAIITKLFEALPRIFMAIFQMLPALVENFLEHVDEFVLAFVEGFIVAAGDIAIAFIDAMLVDGGLERIIGALIRAMPRIAIAFVQGVARGLARVVERFGQMLTGKFSMPMEMVNLPKQIEKAASRLGKTIAKDASKIFKIADLEDSMKGKSDPKKALEEAAERAEMALTEKLGGWLDRLVALWHWVLDNIVNPLINGLREVWLYVFEKIIEPLVGGLTRVWRWVYDNIVLGLINALIEVWRGVWEGLTNFINSLGTFGVMLNEMALGVVTAIVEAFQWVIDNVWVPLATLVSTAFMWVVDNVLTPLVSVVATAFQWVVDNILIPLATAPQVAFQWVVDNIITPLTTIGEKAFMWVKTEIIDKLSLFKWPAFDAKPQWMTEFKWPALSDRPQWMTDFKWPGMPGKPDWITNLKWPAIPEMTLPDAIRNFKWPGLNIDTNALGGNIAVGLWNKLINLDLGRLGSDMAVGLWNKLITFDFGSLLPGGGGGDGGLLGSIGKATGGIIEPMYAQEGRYIAWEPRGTDTVPTMTTPGEFIVNKRSTAANRPLLEKINGSDGPIGMGGGGDVIIQSLVIQPKTAVSEEDIRSKIVPATKTALKRASQDGEFVIHKRGLREG